MIYAYLFAVYKTVKHPRKAHDIAIFVFALNYLQIRSWNFSE